jgi:hypothetical protein
MASFPVGQPRSETCELSGGRSEQATAMIDKRKNDHPEKSCRPLTEQMLEALTSGGGPCEGKNPLR